ncbi:MAG: hypothetical protein EAZ57_04440 [Cytophagales bacterium]|nr:MAG: hypothetical protein EAZ67_05460 [Cytophagales bacterium]TAF61244.1 MAG: hypothetical protein EAZ57_04440 [Cytophagales bacterium]
MTVSVNFDVNWRDEWVRLINKLEKQFGKIPDTNAVLFLVGVQELGRGPLNFSKEEKQDLMHVGLCKTLSVSGHYVLSHWDEAGWPHFTTLKPVPLMDTREQEKYIKQHLISYFKSIGL